MGIGTKPHPYLHTSKSLFQFPHIPIVTLLNVFMLKTTKQNFNIELTFDNWLLGTWNLKYGYCTIQHTNAQGLTSFHNAHSKLQVASIMFQFQ